MSLFITFEGGEGSGKTTQLKQLASALSAKNYSCLVTREPGGTAVGAEIRRLLLASANAHLSPLAELLLYSADRAQHIAEQIRPALAKGQVVLCDRFTDATIAYQGHGRGLDLKQIETLNTLATGGLKPNLTLLLDLPVAVGLARAMQRLQQQTEDEGRFEAEALSFHEKVRHGYLSLAAAEPKRFHIFDASQAVETLHQKILSAVLHHLEQNP